MRNKTVYFMGALGSSMSNLALISQKFGAKVWGHDRAWREGENYPFSITKEFDEDRARISDLIVYTSAIPQNSPEMEFVKKLNIPTLSRAEFLGEISKNFKTTIAISGSHGKTTVTAMVGNILSALNLSPAVHLGGNYPITDFREDYFVTEACEYKDSFLSLHPDVAVVLNVEYDHPDYFKQKSDLVASFCKFIKGIRKGGILISNGCVGGDTKELQINRDILCESMVEENGYYSFIPVLYGKRLDRITLSIPGKHNVQNALFALLVAHALKLPLSHACATLSSFHGVDRRYQKIRAPFGEFTLDYAHHPTEIKCAIDTAKCAKKPIVVYFQPHTYSRTKALFDDFVSALKEGDKVVIIEEFSARELPSDGKRAKDIYEALLDSTKTIYLQKDEVYSYFTKEDFSNNTVLVLGAGDVNRLVCDSILL
ncbi:MAG: hypothetical protein IJF76_04180 [Clostridia bacterium]|nr:hypothetical protein [Clostridia bacterium]